jgi:putative ATP-dependent endonuclease of OLD family
MGISLFDAGNDVSVPEYAPVFAAMGKPVFGIHDQPNRPLAGELVAKAASFAVYRVIPHKGIESLLAAEIPVDVQRRFWATASSRPDYPTDCGILEPGAEDDVVRAHTMAVLKKRKGAFDGYAPLLVAFLFDINATLVGTPLSQPTASGAEPAGDAGGA